MFLDYIKSKFRIVVVDTEFQFDAAMAYVNKPLCIVMKDLSNGHVYKYWNHESEDFAQHHFDYEKTLFVCHYAIAEVSYFLARYMGRPPFIFDTWTEYSKLYKNRRPSMSLVAAATAYDYQNPTSPEEKNRYRDMCINQNKWSNAEQDGIINYCLDDVLMNETVFYGIVEDLEKICGDDYEVLLEQAMARGQSMACVAKAQKNGIPMDTAAVQDFNTYWEDVKDSVIQRFNKDLNLWNENSKFSNVKFYTLVEKLDLLSEWPRTPRGKLKTNNSTFELFADVFPEIKKIKRIFNLLNSTKLAEYIMSEDGRYRPYGGFKMFGTHTGRCAPSSKWVFGTAKWGRNFMKPSFGNVLVYLDYKSEEPFISARLSGDKALEDAYNSGDIYLHTAKLAGLAPANATKETHGDIRKVFKVIVLASN
jgi:DNA polymerase I